METQALPEQLRDEVLTIARDSKGRPLLADTQHICTKYGNRKIYSHTHKRYVNLSEIAEFFSKGETVQIVTNTTPTKDITASCLARLLGSMQLDVIDSDPIAFTLLKQLITHILTTNKQKPVFKEIAKRSPVYSADYRPYRFN